MSYSTRVKNAFSTDPFDTCIGSSQNKFLDYPMDEQKCDACVYFAQVPLSGSVLRFHLDNGCDKLGEKMVALQQLGPVVVEHVDEKPLYVRPIIVL